MFHTTFCLARNVIILTRFILEIASGEELQQLKLSHSAFLKSAELPCICFRCHDTQIKAEQKVLDDN